MSKRIALITDSTCDIPYEWRKMYDIDVIPLTIIWGNEEFLDGIDLSPEDFYKRLESDPITPSTSQATPATFLKAYQKAADKGYDEILVITISAAMSGTFISASKAAENSPIPVHVVDGKNNSMGLGWQVIAAARVRENGGSLEEMMEAAEKVRNNMVYFITLDTMKYLAKGGRIGDAVKFLSSVLKVKPLVLVKPDTGTVGASLPSRSRKAGIESLYKQFTRKINPEKPLHLTVLHNSALEEATKLAERIKDELNPKELFISIVSPILGVHTGPRALALCGYNEE